MGGSDQPLYEGQPQWVIPDQSGEPLEPTRLMKTLVKLAGDRDIGGVCLILPVSEGIEQFTTGELPGVIDEGEGQGDEDREDRR